LVEVIEAAVEISVEQGRNVCCVLCMWRGMTTRSAELSKKKKQQCLLIGVGCALLIGWLQQCSGEMHEQQFSTSY